MSFQDSAAYYRDTATHDSVGGYQDNVHEGYGSGVLAEGFGTGADAEEVAPGTVGLLAGVVTGFLAAAVAIGMAMLASAFVRPQASPVIAVGGWFIDHTPPSLKNFAVQNFGENDKTVLLASMYTVIGILAIVIGVASRRRAVIGMIGIAAFGVFGAYIAATRPESRMTDAIPALAGGVVGVAALLLLHRAAAPARWPA